MSNKKKIKALTKRFEVMYSIIEKLTIQVNILKADVDLIHCPVKPPQMDIVVNPEDVVAKSTINEVIIDELTPIDIMTMDHFKEKYPEIFAKARIVDCMYGFKPNDLFHFFGKELSGAMYTTFMEAIQTKEIIDLSYYNEDQYLIEFESFRKFIKKHNV